MRHLQVRLGTTQKSSTDHSRVATREILLYLSELSFVFVNYFLYSLVMLCQSKFLCDFVLLSFSTFGKEVKERTKKI